VHFLSFGHFCSLALKQVYLIWWLLECSCYGFPACPSSPCLSFAKSTTKGMSQHSTLFSFFPKVTLFLQTNISATLCPWSHESWGKTGVSFGVVLPEACWHCKFPLLYHLSSPVTAVGMHTSAPTIYTQNGLSSQNGCFCHAVVIGYSAFKCFLIFSR